MSSIAKTMQRLFLTTLCIFLICHFCFGQNVTTVKPQPSPLLVIYLNGFRWDYCRDLPGFKKFLQNGTSAEYLLPVFPSSTYPNLYSMFTGLFPEKHGIVSDVMYDPIMKELFYGPSSPSGTKPYWWNEAVPIWTTVLDSDKKAYFYSFPLCGVPIRGIIPDMCRTYHDFDGTETLENDLNAALDILGTGLVEFSMVYSDYLNGLGRMFGPESSEVSKAVVNIDNYIERLMTTIERKGLQDKLNVIITSDHGMSAIPDDPNKHIRFESNQTGTAPEHVNFDDLEFVMSYGAFVGIYPKANKINKVFDDLSKFQGLDVYKQKDIPESMHIKWNNRTAPIVVVARKGYYIDRATYSDKQIPPSNVDSKIIQKGTYGYDPKEVTDMRTVFLGLGPDFKVNAKVSAFSTVDIYNVMSCLMNVTGSANNGSWDAVCDLFSTNCNGYCNNAQILIRSPFIFVPSTLFSLYFFYNVIQYNSFY